MSNQSITPWHYFRQEKKTLLWTSVTGIIYNVGLTIIPLLEGQMVQSLYDVLNEISPSSAIIHLAILYVAVTLIVQGSRALKRLFVRKFANNITRSMKETIYRHILLNTVQEDTGSIMTRAITDAEDCAEGMRKFTTEIFDTGVVMIAYLVTLFCLSWRMSLIVIIFPPLAYILADRLKKKVTTASADHKAALSQLNSAVIDHTSNVLTYRIYGEQNNQSKRYDHILDHYQKSAVISGIWQNSPQHLYYAISMIGVLPILYFGAKNVQGTGLDTWTLASFTSFLSCFTRLAEKSSHAAKLFNAVQKAEVAWNRIKDYLQPEDLPESNPAKPGKLEMRDVTLPSKDHSFSLSHLSFRAVPGEIIGITGKTACGKSSFGRLFIGEESYTGTILYQNQDIRESHERIFAYAGHNPQLFSGTIADNITFGHLDPDRLNQVLKEVELDHEVTPDTIVGNEGTTLSGGQQSRLALARALYSDAPVLILDDPFASLDQKTMDHIFDAIRKQEKNRIILLISSRLEVFPHLDEILFITHGSIIQGTHKELCQNPEYRHLYDLEKGDHHE